MVSSADHKDVQPSLERHLSPELARELLDRYGDALREFYSSHFKACCNELGMLTEHIFICLHYIQTRQRLSEVKNKSKLLIDLENNTALPEAFRILIPRIANALVYDIRSKKGAVHIKGVEPWRMDAGLGVTAISWIIAEFLRTDDKLDEATVSARIEAIMSAQLPLVEVIAGEVIVTTSVPPKTELLLLAAKAGPAGLTRRELGLQAKCSPSRVTEGVQALIKERLMHQAGDARYHITGTGRKAVSEWLSTR